MLAVPTVTLLALVIVKLTCTGLVTAVKCTAETVTVTDGAVTEAVLVPDVPDAVKKAAAIPPAVMAIPVATAMIRYLILNFGNFTSGSFLSV